MEEFTIGLALEDYVTVIFFAVGLYYLWRMSMRMDRSASQLVGFGGLLITFGGAGKATWKLIVAATGVDIVWLDNSQFVFMTPGYIILTAGIIAAIRAFRTHAPAKNLWRAPVIIAVITLGISGFVAFTQEGRAWFFVLLGMTTILNVILSANLVRFSLQEKERLAAVLFVVNILLVFTLAGMAGTFERDLTSQWIEQITNNISFGAFAIASWKIYQRTSIVE